MGHSDGRGVKRRDLSPLSRVNGNMDDLGKKRRKTNLVGLTQRPTHVRVCVCMYPRVLVRRAWGVWGRSPQSPSPTTTPSPFLVTYVYSCIHGAKPTLTSIPLGRQLTKELELTSPRRNCYLSFPDGVPLRPGRDGLTDTDWRWTPWTSSNRATRPEHLALDGSRLSPRNPFPGQTLRTLLALLDVGVVRSHMNHSVEYEDKGSRS